MCEQVAARREVVLPEHRDGPVVVAAFVRAARVGRLVSGHPVRDPRQDLRL